MTPRHGQRHGLAAVSTSRHSSDTGTAKGLTIPVVRRESPVSPRRHGSDTPTLAGIRSVVLCRCVRPFRADTMTRPAEPQTTRPDGQSNKQTKTGSKPVGPTPARLRARLVVLPDPARESAARPCGNRLGQGRASVRQTRRALTAAGQREAGLESGTHRTYGQEASRPLALTPASTRHDLGATTAQRIAGILDLGARLSAPHDRASVPAESAHGARWTQNRTQAAAIGAKTSPKTLLAHERTTP